MPINAVRERPVKQPVEQKKRQKDDGNSVKKLHASRFQGAEFATQQWRVIVPVTDSPRDVLVPEYLSHVCQKIKPLSKIEAVWEDGSKFAEYLVMDIGPNWAKLELLRLVYLGVPKIDPQVVLSDVATEPAPSPLSEDYEIKFINYHFKWSVIRKSDGESMKAEFSTAEEAKKWLDDYVLTITRK